MYELFEVFIFFSFHILNAGNFEMSILYLYVWRGVMLSDMQSNFGTLNIMCAAIDLHYINRIQHLYSYACNFFFIFALDGALKCYA